MHHPHASIDAIGSGIGALSEGHIADAFRALMKDPDARFEDRCIRLLTGAPHPFGNFAMLTARADAGVARAAVDSVIATGAPGAMLTIGAPPADVDTVITGAGFERHGSMPAMAVDIDRLGAAPVPPGYEMERVSDPAHRDAWSGVFSRGYELPERVGEAFGAGITGDARPDAPAQYFWVLNAKGTPVATSVVFLHDGVAGIYAVATLPDERGKGLGAHVTAQPLRIAREFGYRVGVLQASEAGHPVYKRLGFVDVGEVPLWVRMPG